MPTATTTKGEQRRRGLVDAAVGLLCEGGIAAVRHRAVADRAGVPLSATTYYFSSIDDLVASAIEQYSLYEHDRMQNLVDKVTVRRRGTQATVELLVDLFVTPGGVVDRPMLIARYECLAGSARSDALRALQRTLARPYGRMLAEVLRKCRRRAAPAEMTALTALINGTVLMGLLDTSVDLRRITRTALTPVLDVLAPPIDGPGPAPTDGEMP